MWISGRDGDTRRLCIYRHETVLAGRDFGAADIALTLLSIQGFKEMMISSGKILTPELFGFGYNKPVLAVYVLMLVIGAVYVLVGAHGVIRNHVSSVPA